MESLPREFIIFDTEFTAWEGSQERRWSGPGEYREVIQIGAVKVRDLAEADSFLAYVKPVKNPILSEYIVNLTGISQTDIEEKGVPFSDAQERFFIWSGGLPICSFGSDAAVLRENSELAGIPFPFNEDTFFDIRVAFRSCGIDTNGYMSSTIPQAFGIAPPPDAHDAVNDARSILVGLQAAREQGLR